MPKILLIISTVVILASAGLGFLTMKKIPALQASLATYKTNAGATERDVIKAKSDLKVAKAQADAAAQDVSAAKAGLAAAQQELEAQKAKVATLTADNQTLSEQVKKSGETPKVAVEAPKTTEDPRLKELETQLAESKVNLQTQMAKVTEVEAKVKPLEEELAHYKGQARAKGLEGQILAFNPAYNFVVLNLGDRHGVVLNSQVVIFRGNRMVARAKVSSVEPSSSIANILPGSGPRDFRVMPGDRAVYSGS